MHTEISCATAALHTLGDVHTTVKMAETVMFMAMLRNVKVLFTPITSEQKQMATVDFVLLWIVLAVLYRCSRLTNLMSKTLLLCFAPALPTQEPRITVLIAFFVVTAGSIPFWIECHHSLHYPCHHQHFYLTACLGI